MRSSKSRSRNKSGRSRSVGNVVNRVFDSSGPEGKVRGTPQQIIEKYNQLARDAQLANDRVATENFQQHAEHYMRMLGEAQKEMDARREQQERENRERQSDRDRDRERDRRQSPAGNEDLVIDPSEAPQPDLMSVSGDSNLVDLPENEAAQPPRREAGARSRPLRPARGRAQGDGGADAAQDDGTGTPAAASPDEALAAPKPRRGRPPRAKPADKGAETAGGAAAQEPDDGTRVAD